MQRESRTMSTIFFIQVGILNHLLLELSLRHNLIGLAFFVILAYFLINGIFFPLDLDRIEAHLSNSSMSQDISSNINTNRNSLRLLILGSSKSGKSSTLESLAGHNIIMNFKTCQEIKYVQNDDAFGWNIFVVECGSVSELASKDTTNTGIDVHMKNALNILERFHLVLICITFKESMAEGSNNYIDFITSKLGSSILNNNVIVVVTHGEEFDAIEKRLNYINFENWVDQLRPCTLKDLLNKCSMRCVFFKNKTDNDGIKKKQATNLLSMAEDIVWSKALIRDTGEQNNVDTFTCDESMQSFHLIPVISSEFLKTLGQSDRTELSSPDHQKNLFEPSCESIKDKSPQPHRKTIDLYPEEKQRPLRSKLVNAKSHEQRIGSSSFKKILKRQLSDLEILDDLADESESIDINIYSEQNVFLDEKLYKIGAQSTELDFNLASSRYSGEALSVFRNIEQNLPNFLDDESDQSTFSTRTDTATPHKKVSLSNPMSVVRWMSEDVCEPSLDILLLGRSGSGKSSTGNAILMKEAFEIHGDYTKGNVEHCIDYSVFQDRVLKVVDITGLFDPRPHHARDIVKPFKGVDIAITCNPSGYYALLYVIKNGTQYSKDVNAVTYLKQFMGRDCLKSHGILVVTCADTFESDTLVKKDDISLKDWVSEQNDESLNLLVHECSNRVLLFDNITDEKDKKNSQVAKLITMIDTINTTSLGYTNEQFDDAKKEKERHLQGMKIPYLEDDYLKEVALITSRFAIIGNVPEDIDNLRRLSERSSKLLGILQDDKQSNFLKSAFQTVVNTKSIIDSEIDKKCCHFDTVNKRANEEREIDEKLEKLVKEKTEFEAQTDIEIGKLIKMGGEEENRRLKLEAELEDYRKQKEEEQEQMTRRKKEIQEELKKLQDMSENDQETKRRAETMEKEYQALKKIRYLSEYPNSSRYIFVKRV